MMRRQQVISGTFLAVLLGACAGYVPGQQSYWDQKVREMCAQDGGMRIFEKLHVSPSQAGLLTRVDGMFSIPMQRTAHPNAPAYAVIEKTALHPGNPEVSGPSRMLFAGPTAPYYQHADALLGFFR